MTTTTSQLLSLNPSKGSFATRTNWCVLNKELCTSDWYFLWGCVRSNLSKPCSVPKLLLCVLRQLQRTECSLMKSMSSSELQSRERISETKTGWHEKNNIANFHLVTISFSLTLELCTSSFQESNLLTWHYNLTIQSRETSETNKFPAYIYLLWSTSFSTLSCRVHTYVTLSNKQTSWSRRGLCLYSYLDWSVYERSTSFRCSRCYRF